MTPAVGTAVSSRFARTTAARRAFTLVELLVVLGIIGVLLGILLPTAMTAWEAARRVQCLSNLRQMALAADLYATNNADSYPIAYFTERSRTEVRSVAWDLTTTTRGGITTEVTAGLLWEQEGSGRVQQCPSFAGRANWLSDPYTGYNYNTSYIGHGQNESIVRPAARSSVRRPVEVALFGDGQYSAGANKFMRSPWPSPGDAGFAGRWAGTQGYRHRGRTNVVFCDGHAETITERYTQNRNGAANVAQGTGFLSPDNSAYGE